MADKLKQGIAVVPEFVDGENTRAAKLNALGSQMQRAASLLEKAVGDLHGESHPYSSLNSAHLSLEWGRSLTSDAALADTATRALDIANIARLIGPAANLNPYLPNETVFVTEVVPAGVYEFTLRFPATSISSATDTYITTLKATADLLTAAGDYCIDAKGRIAVHTATSGGTVTYQVTPSAWGSGPNYTGASFNVIPDPNQLEAGGSGCTVSGSVDSQGRHTITLPTISHIIRNAEGTSTTLTAADPLFGEQIYLPSVLIDWYSSEEVIPGSFLYLKNWTTGEVYKDATYYYSDSFHVLVGGVDLADEVAAGDKFVLVTVGTDITSMLDDLRVKFGSHNHDRSRGEAAVDASDIVGWTSEAGASGRFTISKMAGNFAPQYLHRDGYQASESDLNDQNIMRGDLVMGLETASAGGYYSDAGATKSVYFGTTSGPSIRKTDATTLRVYSPSGNVDLLANQDINLDATGGIFANQQVLLDTADTYEVNFLGINFIPQVYSTTDVQYSLDVGYVTTVGSEAVAAQLPFRIPDGAVITNVQMTWWNTLGADVTTLTLNKVDHLTGAFTTIATVVGTGVVTTVSSSNTTVISDPTISYATHNYLLKCDFAADAASTPRLYSVGIFYTSDKMGN